MRTLVILGCLVTTASASPDAGPRRTPAPSEPLSGSQVLTVMRRLKPAFQACYANALKKNPKLGGAFAYAFTVEPTGTVSQAAPTQTTSESGPVDACITGVLRKAVFPRSSGQTKITRPFNFSSHD